MFQSLRQNSQIYIFHKGQNPSLETGIVTNIPVAKPKYSQTVPSTFGQPEMVVDLIVKINDHVINYNGLPASADIADTYANGETIVVSDNREAMNSEIFSYKQRSIDIINSIDQHKNIITGCDNILNQLNPEFAEKQQQQEELCKLKEQMSIMSKSMQDLMESNKKLIEQLNGKETTK